MSASGIVPTALMGRTCDFGFTPVVQNYEENPRAACSQERLVVIDSAGATIMFDDEIWLFAEQLRKTYSRSCVQSAPDTFGLRRECCYLSTPAGYSLHDRTVQYHVRGSSLAWKCDYSKDDQVETEHSNPKCQGPVKTVDWRPQSRIAPNRSWQRSKPFLPSKASMGGRVELMELRALLVARDYRPL
ncbi:uncharacterized protein B0I36DRAFT_351437 [Microdochium trichocladiopsis]|uniref:Uncharacterized protein n=1 Tax=Microdochium trichocladiopsis TaxID=1682393 RepID=A0A9P9BNZ3_9PEZI|nr:uncharacterized protein B0I36DRAFT_351437 [Microdochium trichocladiopsis]KAH7027984.1 hypothetical protein B0I36DRAFT_351437 [Microdochium trichocladiopsis]